jgi:hypothetical protein
MHSLYDWNRFSLVPPGYKAVIYKSPEACTSWGSRRTDTWYVGPSLDHYPAIIILCPKLGHAIFLALLSCTPNTVRYRF